MAAPSYSGGKGYNPLDYYKQQLLPLASLGDYMDQGPKKDTSPSSADALTAATPQYGPLSIGAIPPEEVPAESSGSPELAPSPGSSKPQSGMSAQELAALAVGAWMNPALAAGIEGAVATARGLQSARDTYQQGHGRQQAGIMQAANAPAVGVNSQLGNPLNPEQAGNAAVESQLAHNASTTQAPSNYRSDPGFDQTSMASFAANADNPAANAAGNAVLLSNPATAPYAVFNMGAQAAGVKLPNFFSGKSRDQAERDAIRSNMQRFGLLDDNYLYKLPDGSTFDFGKDGGARTQQGTHYYEYNTEDPMLNQINRIARPAAALLAGGRQDLTDSMSNYLTNMAMSNQNTYEGMRQNILDFTGKLKMSPQQVKDQLTAWRDEGRISDEQLTEYVNTIQNELMEGGQSTYEPQQPSPATPADNPRLKALPPPVQKSAYWQAASGPKPIGAIPQPRRGSWFGAVSNAAAAKPSVGSASNPWKK